MKGERGELSASVVSSIHFISCCFCALGWWTQHFTQPFEEWKVKLSCWKNSQPFTTQCYNITVITYCLSLFVIFKFNPFVVCINVCHYRSIQAVHTIVCYLLSSLGRKGATGDPGPPGPQGPPGINGECHNN